MRFLCGHVGMLLGSYWRQPGGRHKLLIRCARCNEAHKAAKEATA